MNKSPFSKRFKPSSWMEKLVPFILLLLALALLATLVIIIISSLGLLPAR